MSLLDEKVSLDRDEPILPRSPQRRAVEPSLGKRTFALILLISTSAAYLLYLILRAYNVDKFTFTFSVTYTGDSDVPAARPTLQLSADETTRLSSHCASTPPISASEFHSRAKSLATILHDQGASAYIAEPGANALYFTNISGSLWGLSERPLLLIVSPEWSDSIDANGGSVEPRITVLTPMFEAARAKLLPYAASNVTFVEWPEDGNPYEIAMAAVKSASVSGSDDTVYVDDYMRHFIVDGLQAAIPSATVKSASPEIKALRERKSPAEIALLRCANEATLLALRSVRDQLSIGVRESDVRAMMVEALTVAGLKGGSALTMFGENAALPHGSGTDRVLGPTDFILIDTGGSLHGYASDLTRTFALPTSTIPSSHLEIWYTVQAAQTAAINAVHNQTVTSAVDAAARTVIDDAGYGAYFTHRLGHGIGLETHEAPYLRGGSTDKIQSGNAFSDEPGVYIEGKIGVRLEDCFYVDDEGKAVYFTEGVGGTAVSPWKF